MAQSSPQRFDFDAAFAARPVILAPMEDVSDAIFRRLCRARGADICVTEFINVEGLLRGCRIAARKVQIEAGDFPTAIQIYGSDPERLAEAAEFAAAQNPAYLDINCGCWVPKIARRGAGAGWLRDPDKMVEMAAMVVKRLKIPVTVKTRIGWGPESDMPIVTLAKRLEDVGVRALTVHCRTALMGYTGKADWTWAEKAKAEVRMPVIVNGDIQGPHDVARALEITGCQGAMIGRYAIEHPWVFREARALLDRGEVIDGPTWRERIGLCQEHLLAEVEVRGELRAIRVLRRYYPGYLKGLRGAASVRKELNTIDVLAEALERLDAFARELEEHGSAAEDRVLAAS